MTDDNDDNNEREDKESTEDTNDDHGANVHLTASIPVKRKSFFVAPRHGKRVKHASEGDQAPGAVRQAGGKNSCGVLCKVENYLNVLNELMLN